MKQRLVYIDVIRGLCIFVVVYTHVAEFCTGGMYYPKTSVHQFLTSFFLTMFYFISGMMCYKDDMLPNIRSLLHFLVKKVRTLLVPSVIVSGGYSLIVEKSLKPVFCPLNLWIAWFTYVLFFVSVIFGIVMYGCSKTGRRNTRMVLLLCVAACSYMLSRRGVDAGQYEICFRLHAVLYYLPFFFFGSLCKMVPKILGAVETNDFCAFILCGVAVAGLVIEGVPLVVRNVLVIMMVYYLTKKYTEQALGTEQCYWASLAEKRFVGFFKVLGRNSLEIYFLHFILLFRLPDALVGYLVSLNNDECWWGGSSASFAELLVVGSLSSVVAVGSVLFAMLLMRIPYVGLLLFGKGNRRK